MVNKYNLVNPFIKGKMETTLKAKNSHEAATMFYTNISEHFNNEISEFYFTIQKGGNGDGKFYHFKVNEKKQKNEVVFDIKEFQVKNENYMETKFKGKLEEYKKKIENDDQEGGASKSKNKKKTSKKHKKHKKSDSSSDSDYSSDSDDIYIRTRKTYYTEPIYYWWYDPYIYNINNLFVPTFYPYTTPAAFTIAINP